MRAVSWSGDANVSRLATDSIVVIQSKCTQRTTTTTAAAASTTKVKRNPARGRVITHCMLQALEEAKPAKKTLKREFRKRKTVNGCSYLFFSLTSLMRRVRAGEAQRRTFRPGEINDAQTVLLDAGSCRYMREKADRGEEVFFFFFCCKFW